MGPAMQPWSLSAARAAPNAEFFLLHATIQVPNDAEGLHRAEPPGRSGHVVSLVIKDEARVLAVAEQMVARHIPGLA